MNMNKDSPIIVDLGDSDYCTIYGYDINSDNLDIEYRYTGEKSPMDVEQILSSIIQEVFEKTMRNL